MKIHYCSVYAELESIISHKSNKMYYIISSFFLGMIICSLEIISTDFIYAKTIDDLLIEQNRFGSDIPHIKVGRGPSEIEIGHGLIVYVANTLSNTVSAINTDTMKVTEIPVKDPDRLEFNDRNNKLYISHSLSTNISVYDTNSGNYSEINVGRKINDMAIDSKRSILFLVSFDFPSIIGINMSNT